MTEQEPIRKTKFDRVIELLTEVTQAGFGSLEVYVQDGEVTQITKRIIEKQRLWKKKK